MARTYGYAVIPWSPLAGGLLTGKYRRDNRNPEGVRFSNIEDNKRLKARKSDALYDVVEALDPLVKRRGCTMAQLALAWVLRQPGVTSPIIGPRTMVSPFYEADFGPHLYR